MKMYKDEHEAYVDKAQVELMEKSGWSKDKPEEVVEDKNPKDSGGGEGKDGEGEGKDGEGEGKDGEGEGKDGEGEEKGNSDSPRILAKPLKKLSKKE